jgi:hypothetical protein
MFNSKHGATTLAAFYSKRQNMLGSAIVTIYDPVWEGSLRCGGF